MLWRMSTSGPSGIGLVPGVYSGSHRGKWTGVGAGTDSGPFGGSTEAATSHEC